MSRNHNIMAAQCAGLQLEDQGREAAGGGGKVAAARHRAAAISRVQLRLRDASVDSSHARRVCSGQTIIQFPLNTSLLTCCRLQVGVKEWQKTAQHHQ